VQKYSRVLRNDNPENESFFVHNSQKREELGAATFELRKPEKKRTREEEQEEDQLDLAPLIKRADATRNCDCNSPIPNASTHRASSGNFYRQCPQCGLGSRCTFPARFVTSSRRLSHSISAVTASSHLSTARIR
jgi:hypothetical protein